jgi:hypothetical protein
VGQDERRRKQREEEEEREERGSSEKKRRDVRRGEARENKNNDHLISTHVDHERAQPGSTHHIPSICLPVNGKLNAFASPLERSYT